MVSSFSGASWMVMRSISWLRPSTLLRKRGAEDLDIGMGIRMVLGIGDCKTQTQTWLQFMSTLRLRTEVAVTFMKLKESASTEKKIRNTCFLFQTTHEKLQLTDISIH